MDGLYLLEIDCTIDLDEFNTLVNQIFTSIDNAKAFAETWARLRHNGIIEWEDDPEEDPYGEYESEEGNIHIYVWNRKLNPTIDEAYPRLKLYQKPVEKPRHVFTPEEMGWTRTSLSVDDLKLLDSLMNKK
jgi:hypothetical protein